jgi:hypothetical protein
MASTNITRMKTDAATPVPTRGTIPSAANQFFAKGTMVSRNDSGDAVSPVTDDATAFPIMGVSNASQDNRTGSEAGGLAGNLLVEISYGVFGFDILGDDPMPGQVVFAVDNQTVSTDSDTDTRGIAGYVTEVRDDQAFVLLGPTVAGQIVIAAAEAADLDTAQADIDELQADALTAQAFIPIPITSWTEVTGAPVAVFADGTVNGLSLVDSEALGYRFNPVGQDTSELVTSVPLPPDLDDAADIVLHVLCFRIGASDVTTVLAGKAFFQTVGAAHTADSDAITIDSAAIDAATTVVEEVTLTIDAADVPAAPANLTLTLAPSAALDADDLVICGTWIEYTRALLTA